MSKAKVLCQGCRNDFYNHNREGGCWSFEKAKVVQRTRVGYFQEPPYTWNPVTTLSCYHEPGIALISKDDCRLKENWKS